MLTQGNARLPGESFKTYRKRLRNEQTAIKHHLQGRVIRPNGVQFFPHPVTGAILRTKGRHFNNLEKYYNV
jgi:hypothetical protein